MKRRQALRLGALVLGILPTDPLLAQEAAAPPPNYVAVFLGTTAAYRPPEGSWDGPQNDLTLTVGYGRCVSKTISLELDLGPTWIDGDYTAFALVPGIVWSFHPKAYAAARFIVPVDPEIDFAVAPGLGLIHTFGNGISPLLEVNAVSYLGEGSPDLGLSVTAGVLYFF